jgi:hypothetical protein
MARRRSIEQGEFSNDRPTKAAQRWHVPVIARARPAPAATLVAMAARLVVTGCGPVWALRGKIYLAQRDFTHAEPDLLKATELDANLEPAYILLGHRSLLLARCR